MPARDDGAAESAAVIRAERSSVERRLHGEVEFGHGHLEVSRSDSCEAHIGPIEARSPPRHPFNGREHSGVSVMTCPRQSFIHPVQAFEVVLIGVSESGHARLEAALATGPAFGVLTVDEPMRRV